MGGVIGNSRGARRRATAAALSLAAVAVAVSTSSSTAFVHCPLTPRGVPSQQESAPRRRGVGETATTTSLPADSSLFPGYESFNRGGEGGDLTAGGGPDEDTVYEYDDFAGFDSAQLAPLDDVGGASLDSDDGGSTFASSLERRMQQVEGGSNRLPLMILDTMLPRQVLKIQIQHPTLKSLMRHRAREEVPTLGMLGMAKLSTGQTLPLKAGVEVEILEMGPAEEVIPGTVGISLASGDDEEEEAPWDVSLRATRRFVIEGDVDKSEEGWTEASVKFIDSSEEEEAESSGVSVDAPEGDRMSVARAISKARTFTEPNMGLPDGQSLVERWVELARQNERTPGQIDALLSQLGDIPPVHEPTERALWVGALINPLPGMGVAVEIRPALLVSKRAEERVQVALDGLMKSIAHMDGTARMW